MKTVHNLGFPRIRAKQYLKIALFYASKELKGHVVVAFLHKELTPRQQVVQKSITKSLSVIKIEVVTNEYH